MIGYHFTNGDKLRNGRLTPPIGEWLTHDGPVVPCESGLHASEHPFDALTYACGEMLHRVELKRDLVPRGDPVDKYVGRRRKILATIDATELLNAFARWCALQVIDLWGAPNVVREYLETGDEPIRDAAWDAAWDAASASWASRAARAARAASAARDAWGATSASWAARYAASAARDASASWASWASRAAAWDAQRKRFAEMVDEAFTRAKRQG